jgi:protein-L-isoaspartate O-methyltransferase
MLAEAGGIAAERTRPEVGGAVRCWASPGYGRGWSYIRKVNKVSVTVEDNWGNGGRNFTRTIPFDKLKAVMPRAEVEEKRAAGLLAEVDSGIGFYLRDEPAPAPREKPAVDPAAVEFRAMAESLRAGVRVVSAPNLFPTPPDVARRVVELAEIGLGMEVLEPSAGTGNLIAAIRKAEPTATVTAVELVASLADHLRRTFPQSVTVRAQDFLSIPTGRVFDRIVMNPPFDHGADIMHVEHAQHFLVEGGRLVAIVANGPRQREKFEPVAMVWIDLPPGTFAGTNTRAAIVVIDS